MLTNVELPFWRGVLLLSEDGGVDFAEGGSVLAGLRRVGDYAGTQVLVGFSTVQGTLLFGTLAPGFGLRG